MAAELLKAPKEERKVFKTFHTQVDVADKDTDIHELVGCDAYHKPVISFLFYACEIFGIVWANNSKTTWQKKRV